MLGDEDAAIRYWGALGILIRGPNAVATTGDALHTALDDPSPVVRITAAEALGRFGSARDAERALDVLVRHADPVDNGFFVAVQALNAIDYLDDRARSAVAAIAQLPDRDPSAHDRLGDFVARLKEKILANLQR